MKAQKLYEPCDACKTQMTKGRDDAAHAGLIFVFKNLDPETQYLCDDCGETIFYAPDKTPAWH
jgi:hypothetical protein